MFNIIFLLIGTMIGAGFASGKEIFIFFGKYSYLGIFGIVISSLLFYIVINSTLQYILKNNINSYNDFITTLFGKKLSILILSFVNIFLLLSFFIMVAGFSAFLKQEFNFSTIFGSSIVAILLFVTLANNSNGILKLNKILIPFLILIFLYLFFYSFKYSSSNIYYFTNSSFVLDAILYTSYNSITIIPIIISFSKNIKSQKTIKYISIITTIIFFVLSIIIYSLLRKISIDINSIEIPIMYLSNQFGIFNYLYGFSILIAIFTSAVSSGYSFLENINNTPIKSFILCIFSIPFSYVGFSRLVELFYPIFGYLGFLQILLLLLKNKSKTDINYIRLQNGDKNGLFRF